MVVLEGSFHHFLSSFFNNRLNNFPTFLSQVRSGIMGERRVMLENIEGNGRHPNRSRGGAALSVGRLGQGLENVVQFVIHTLRSRSDQK